MKDAKTSFVYHVLGQPSDIAYGVLYLASDESKFVTGIELILMVVLFYINFIQGAV